MNNEIGLFNEFIKNMLIPLDQAYKNDLKANKLRKQIDLLDTILSASTEDIDIIIQLWCDNNQLEVFSDDQELTSKQLDEYNVLYALYSNTM